MLVGHNGVIVLLPRTFLCNSAADNNSNQEIQVEGECYTFMSSHLINLSVKKQYIKQHHSGVSFLH